MFNDTTMHETTLKQNDIIETWLHTEQYHRDIDAQNGIIRASLNTHSNSTIDTLLHLESYHKADFKLCKMATPYTCIQRSQNVEQQHLQ